MNGLSQKIRNIWGHGDDDDYDRDDETAEEETTMGRATGQPTSSTAAPTYGGGSGGYQPRRPRLVAPSPLRSGREKNIYTLKPKSQEDAAVAADYLKTGTAVIINLEDVERSNAIRIIDFMSGVCYGLEHQGHAMKLGDTIFLYTPGDFEISSDEPDYTENEAPFFNDVSARKAAQQQAPSQTAQAQPAQQPQAQTVPVQQAPQQVVSQPVSQLPQQTVYRSSQPAQPQASATQNSASQSATSQNAAQPNPYAPSPRRGNLIPDAPSQHASPSPSYTPERRPWER